MRKVLCGLISLYQAAVSPLLGDHCRFHPTCSEYAKEAITRHGILRGGALAIWRLARCQPWNRGGFDPVPRHNSLPNKNDTTAFPIKTKSS
jgi:putative membrane protein insertion efficiency factor